MSRNIIWYRSSQMDDDELNAAQKYFFCVDSRTKIEHGDFVVARYSALPYFKEQLYDVEQCIGAKLINGLREHFYIADLGNWYSDLYDLTPKTWFRFEEVPIDGGPFVLKGTTNSRKSRWKTHMFAKNRAIANEIYWELCNDPLICDSGQGVCIREYVPLVKLTDGIGGIPISKEFRCFVAYGEVISKGFYWHNYADDLDEVPNINEVPQEFLDKVIKRIGNKSNFYTIDVAQKQDGDWIVVELNSGCQAGLPLNDPDELYKNLRKVLDKND